MTSPADWSEDAFFEIPERNSVDGGTTSAGALWHGVSVRWGHSMHTMCSYHGMFPAKVAHYFIQRYSKPGERRLGPVQRSRHGAASGTRRRAAGDL